jgi:hypothetical protein
MTALHRAVLRAYDAGAHKADVQLVTSLPTHLADIPVATDIPATECVAGRECAVLLFDDNPNNAVVITIHGAVPATPTVGAIHDADGDTYVRTEQSAEEDKVRMAAGGTLRYVIGTASPHHDLTGDLRLSGVAQVASAGATPTDKLLTVGGGGDYHGKAGVYIQAGNTGSVGVNSVVGVAGYAYSQNTADTTVIGLDFVAGGGAGAPSTLATLVGVRTKLDYLVFGGAVTDARDFWARSPSGFGTWSAVYGYYVDALTIGSTRYPFYDAGTTADANNRGNVFKTNTQLFKTTLDFGGGAGVLGIAAAVTAPSTNPTNGVILYVDPADNKLKCRGAAGTVTVLAVP